MPEKPKEKKKPGPKPSGLARARVLRVRVHDDELARMERLAAAAGVTLAEWLRRRGLTE